MRTPMPKCDFNEVALQRTPVLFLRTPLCGYFKIRAKIFATKKRKNEKLDATDKFDNSFCIIFDHHYKYFISGRKTRY